MNEKSIMASIKDLCKYIEEDTEAFLIIRDEEHINELKKDMRLLEELIGAMELMVGGEVAE